MTRVTIGFVSELKIISCTVASLCIDPPGAPRPASSRSKTKSPTVWLGSGDGW